MATLEHAAVACNRVSHAVDWNSDGLVAFAGSLFVCLYRPQSNNDAGIFQTLKGHQDRVNCVSFVRQGSEDSRLIVSASADKSCILWRCNTLTQRWEISCRFSQHQQGVVALATVRGRELLKRQTDLIASSSSDGTILVWERSDTAEGKDRVEMVQRISTGRHHMMALALAYLPASQAPILLAGGTDMKLHVHVRPTSSEPFQHMLSLQGHSDWIRSIQIATFTNTHEEDQQSKHKFNDGDLIIASASQDRHIRIWRSTLAEAASSDTLSTKAHLIKVSDQSFAFMFDALLMGHDDWVHSVSWQPSNFKGKYHYAIVPMALISASADKSIMLWEPDEHSDSWVYRARLGEVGGTSLGFYGALLSPSGELILSNGYNGALHIWKHSSKRTEWHPVIGISGHESSIESLSWDPTGAYFMSASLDQTSRVFAPWVRNGMRSWHEIARPQIHGYDLNCIAFVHKYQYISGADEKIVRVFDAPRTFAMTLQNITGIAEARDVLDHRPVGANVPALGLSNKAVFEEDVKNADASHDYRNLSSFTAVAATPTSLTAALSQPPFEEHLLQHTLWPETNKLYGHGYEIIAVAANNLGTLVASACKAAKSEHAAVRLWSTSTWKEVCPALAFHSLTVTTIRFSPDGRHLLTAGRDRSWALFNVERALAEGVSLLEASEPKAHSRIIWAVDWTPDGLYFATASRDKLVKVWGLVAGSWSVQATLKFDESVTMINFNPSIAGSRYLVAVGLETGEICMRTISRSPDGSLHCSDDCPQIHPA
eukprot:jgi/Hompol1/6239/HPOL_004898-RA